MRQPQAEAALSQAMRKRIPRTAPGGTVLVIDPNELKSQAG